MKFDFIVGNPPYQSDTVGDQKNFGKPIYNDFMDEAYKIGNVVELITPARFLFNAGSTPKNWNKKMLNDKHFKVLKYYADCKEAFPNQDIKGGVAITLHDKGKDFGAVGAFTAFPELNTILDKVKNFNGFSSLSDIVFSRTEYRFTDLMHKEHPEAITQQSKEHPYDVSTNIFEILPQIFFDKKPNDGKEYIQIYGREKNERVYKYVRRDYIIDVKNLDKYKVFVPKSNGSGTIGEVLSTPVIGRPVIGRPVIGHTETFISIGVFDSESESKALYKYICTKFLRAMLGILKATQDNPPAVWKYVPLQDFTENSDIDWSKTIHEIDLELYKKYGLDEKEIDFIETHVKEME